MCTVHAMLTISYKCHGEDLMDVLKYDHYNLTGMVIHISHLTNRTVVRWAAHYNHTYFMVT